MRPFLMQRGVWTAILLGLSFGFLYAQDAETPSATVGIAFHAARPTDELAVTRTALARLLPECPLVNGKLNEAAWQGSSLLTPFSRSGSTRIASPRTMAMVGYYAGYIYIGIQCDEPRSKRRVGIAHDRDGGTEDEDCIQILLDSILERSSVNVISVNAAGVVTDYTVVEGERDLSWDIECVAAAAPTATGWAVEIGIPRKAFDNPINDIIGFNIVRRRPGSAREPFSWNPAPASYEDGKTLGCLAFQRREITIEKVELGKPYVGANTFRVWLKNETDEELPVRVGIATHVEEEAADTSRYRLVVPSGGTRAYALPHRIRVAGRSDFALSILNDELGYPLVRVMRPGLTVVESPLVLTPNAESAETSVKLDFNIMLPKREIKGVNLFALFRDPETGKVLGRARTGWVTSRSGVVGVDTSALAPGTYRLYLYLQRDGAAFASAEYAVTITPPEKPND